MKIQGVCQLETSLKSAGQIQLMSVHLLLRALAVYLDQQTKENFIWSVSRSQRDSACTTEISIILQCRS